MKNHDFTPPQADGAGIFAAKLCAGFGQFHTNEIDPKDPGKRLKPYTEITWREIIDMVDNPPQRPKPRAQWLIPSELLCRNFAKQEAEGQFWALWADLDAMQGRTLDELAETIELIAGTVDFEIYNTRSATPENQKARILLPLAAPAIGADWVLIQQIFNDKLQEFGFVPDRKSEGAAQLLYLPNRGSTYEVRSSRQGRFFQPLVGWASAIEAKRHELAVEQRAAEQAREAAKSRRRAPVESGRYSDPIQAFNSAYDVAEILMRNGYSRRGKTFRHPASESGSYSASIKGGRVHALSSSDKLYTGGKDGGAHDAFSAFATLEHGGDRDAALRDAGDQWLTIAGESWNAAARRDYAQQRQSAQVAAVDISGLMASVASVNAVQQTGDDWQAQLEQHPLAQFVTVDAQPKQPKWIIRGFLADGVTVIAGSGGIGKTTAILPLTLCAAGLTGNDLAQAEMQPRHWRHVVYVTEDLGQAQRIIAGIINHGDIGISLADVQERFHLVPAMRLSVDTVVQVGELYSRRFTRMIGDVPVLPLVVFDTKSAVFELEDENSNSETSRMVAALKQCFHSLPVWLIAHVAKSNMGRDDVKTARGASSQGDDGNGTAFLIEGKEPDKRYLILGKKRFEPKWLELEITSHTAVTTAADEYGIPEPLTLRWSTAAPPTQSRQEAAEAAEIERLKMDETTLRLEIFNAVETAWQLGNPLNRAGVKAKIARKAAAVVAMLEILLSERWLHEVEVPKNLRTHPRRSSFLVKLTTAEHDALMAGKGLPAEKTTIPESWQKAPIPIVPESEPGNDKNKEDAA